MSAAVVPRASEVEAILARGGPRLRRRMLRAEAHLAQVAGQIDGPLARHAAATIAAGGKRLRPLLVFLAAHAVAGSPGHEGAGRGPIGADAEHDVEQPLTRAAVAVELVHSATLIHDDILDNADLRRGRPTVVAAAGRDMAIAAGDLLFSRAFAELACNASSAQLQALSEASSALAVGELLQREDAYAVDVALDRYLRRCELKTARLFEAACRLGVLAGGNGDQPRTAIAGLADGLGAFARRVGLAFQLLDDVLDVSGPSQRTGKPRGTDLLDGTVTLPLILAREIDPALGSLDLRALAGPDAAEAVCERIARTGALEAARRRALGFVYEAKAQLPRQLSASRRALLELVADAVVERYA
jgi:geranylgeranyl pyrophosphate synthase